MFQLINPLGGKSSFLPGELRGNLREETEEKGFEERNEKDAEVVRNRR